MDSDYDYPFAKVSDERTIFYENTNSKKVGIFVDVFPLDNLFNDKEMSVSYMTDVYRKIKIPRNIKYLRWSQNRSLFKNLLYFILKPFVMHRSTRYFAEEITKCALINKGENTGL